jgi:hypothetical protein
LSLRADGVFATAACPVEPAEQDARRPPDDGQRVRVALLRHEDARAGVRLGEVDEVELRAGEDLQVLGELVLGEHQAGGAGEHVQERVGLPHRVAGVRDGAVEAQGAGGAVPVVEDRRPVGRPDPAGLR